MHTSFSNDTSDSREICTVSEINQQLKQTIAGKFPLIWVEGEISNLARPASGHLYFSLKDKHAQLRCVMFRSHNQRVPFEITNGLQVVVRAGASVYEARGDLQLIVDNMEEAGFGALQKQFEALKKKLFEEGLFDDSRKKTIPKYPSHIALVTSASGAACKDYLKVAQRRFPACKKSLYSVLVQGDQAAHQLSSAILAINKQSDIDVIILIRGGGSIEDLWCFNDENLARVIADSTIPIVTGIGHEIDYTIADFVADLRAPTPSVAAELTCPDSDALKSTLSYLQQLLTRHTNELIQSLAQSTDWLSQRIQRSHPATIVANQKQSLKGIVGRLQRSSHGYLKESMYRFHSLLQRHKHQSPLEIINQQHSNLLHLNQRLQRAIDNQYEQRRHQLQLCSTTMQAVSPLNTLQRGYSITTKGQCNRPVITDSKQLKQGDQIITYLAKGEVVSRVESTSSNTIIKSASDTEHSEQ